MARLPRRCTAVAAIFCLLAGAVAAQPVQAPVPKPRPALGKLIPPQAAPAVSSRPAGSISGEAGSTGQPTERRLPRPRPGLAASGEPGPDRTARPKLLPPAAAGRVSAASAIDGMARLPRARPDALPAGALAMVPPDPDPAAEPPLPPVPAVPADVAADGGACLDRLRKLGVVFERAPAITDRGCAVANPLVVKALGSGVSLTSEATLNCPTTEAVALWVRDVLLPYARDQLRARPTAIVPGSTYACRTRNGRKGARMSEHAAANAFDVMSVEFAGRPPLEIRARGMGDPEGRFQAAIRQGSCAYFTTVLGPGSDASHGNHLHFDLAQRRGGHRLCSMGGDRTAGGK